MEASPPDLIEAESQKMLRDEPMNVQAMRNNRTSQPL